MSRGDGGTRPALSVDRMLSEIEEQIVKVAVARNTTRRNWVYVMYGLLGTLTIASSLLFYYRLFHLDTLSLLVIYSSVFFIIMLYSQYVSMHGEITSFLPEVRYPQAENGGEEGIRSREVLDTSPTSADIEILKGVLEVNRGGIDKMFEKLKSFSTSWVLITGGILSSLLIEFFKGDDPFISSIYIIFFASLLYTSAQIVYSEVSYELIMASKKLTYWWAVNTRGSSVPR